jgi:predicted pyridoxine 5'-phosphate oxidase superfamily flavin-nucleotide-binding protein
MKLHERIDQRLREFIEAQHMFFVGTAPESGGHVNISPKGYRDSFAVIDERTFAYLDLFGSGAETIAHVRENGRITILFVSFTRNSNLVRLYGTGRVVRPDTEEFARLAPNFNLAHPGLRSIIVVDVERIADSCGYTVPYMQYVDERPVLDDVHAKRTPDVWAKRVAEVNNASIDGLPALEPDHPLPTSIPR